MVDVIESALRESYNKARSPIVDNEVTVVGKALFGMDVWDCSELVKLPSASNWQKTLNFESLLPVSGLPDDAYQRFIIPLKEFAYARLRDPVRGFKKVSVLTVGNELCCIKPFILWCISKDIRGFSDVTKRDLNNYHEWLGVMRHEDGQGYRPSRIVDLISAIAKLYQFRSRMSEQITCNPFKKDSLAKQAGLRYDAENKTPVIPENVYMPYMGLAHDYVMYYSGDILSVMDAIYDLANEVKETSDAKTYSGINKAFSRRVKDLFLGKPISASSRTGKPWRNKWCSMQEYLEDLRQLNTAAMIISMGLSGIRISEYFSLKKGCISDHSADDDVYGRIYLKGKVYKKKVEPLSVTWVVNDVVAKAINVIERITEPFRDITGHDELCLANIGQLPIFLDYKGFKSTQDFIDNVRLPSASSMVVRLNKFAAHCVYRFNAPPEVKEWNFNTRQLRRTLAHFIAKEPFGVVAGAMQFKHVETYLFEGYAGSDPTFLEMLNKERAAVSIGFMDDILADAEDGQLAGPKGLEILEQFRGVAGERKGKNIDYYLDNKRRNIYPGMFNYCFFDPDRALCLKGKKETSNPVMNACSPRYCGNSCIGNKHLPNWLSQIKDADDMLARCKSGPQHMALESERNDLIETIKPLLEKGGRNAKAS